MCLTGTVCDSLKGARSAVSPGSASPPWHSHPAGREAVLTPARPPGVRIAGRGQMQEKSRLPPVHAANIRPTARS